MHPHVAIKWKIPDFLQFENYFVRTFLALIGLSKLRRIIPTFVQRLARIMQVMNYAQKQTNFMISALLMCSERTT